MKKEKILKLMVVLTIGTILVAMISNVFAADSSSGIDFFEDQFVVLQFLILHISSLYNLYKHLLIYLIY